MFVRYMSTIGSLGVHYVSTMCPLCVFYVLIVRTLFVRTMFTICSLIVCLCTFAQFLFASCSLFVRYSSFVVHVLFTSVRMSFCSLAYFEGERWATLGRGGRGAQRRGPAKFAPAGNSCGPPRAPMRVHIA